MATHRTKAGTTFRALAPSIPAPLVSDFLRDSGWALTGRGAGVEYWLPPSESAETAEGCPYTLPLDKGIREHDHLVAEVLVRLAQHYGDDAPQLIRRIKATQWDTLALKVEGASGDVALGDAACLLKAGMDMLRLAALHTDNPYRMSWGSRRSAPVAEYLRDGVRLGLTGQCGSTFPLLSRVWQSEAEAPPFGRHVMTNLAGSMTRIHERSTRKGGEGTETELFDAAIARTLLPLLQVENLTLSIRWASDPSLAAPDAPLSTFTFDASHFHGIEGTPPGVARKGEPKADPTPAQPTAAPPAAEPRAEIGVQRPAQRFTGHVRAAGVNHHFARHGESPHFIVLHAHGGDYFISVSPEEYQFSLRARMQGRTVTAVGTSGIRAGRRVLRGSLVRDESTIPGQRRGA
ncbi:hypothetical protein ACIQ9R_35360 [Streptomyces sp. NPDC094447]|uniref:hypothetical protein n=1 Tax=Streptomyces sp. NPDC094447 TaxID=3366062 RepID=UPI0037FC9C67